MIELIPTCKYEDIDELAKKYKNGDTFTCKEEDSSKSWTCTINAEGYNCQLNVYRPNNFHKIGLNVGSAIFSQEDIRYISSLLPNFKYGSLLYRATAHGFKRLDFHSRCDNKTNTIILVRSENGRKFGGYTT